MIKNSALMVGILLLVMLASVVLTCSEAPFRPTGKGPTGYGVYFYDESDNPKWYIYYPESDYLDSAYLPVSNVFRAIISPSGDRMYWSRGLGVGLVVVDLITEVKLAELSQYYGATLAHSPDGKYLAVRTETLDILNVEDLSVAYRDTLPQLGNIVFASDSRTLHGVLWDPEKRVEYYGTADIETLSNITIDTLSWGEYGIGRSLVIPGSLPDQRLILGLTMGYYMFFDWNTASNQLSFDTVCWIACDPELFVSPDRRYAINTRSCYNLGDSQHQSCQFRVWDALEHKRVETVNTQLEVAPGDTVYFDMTEVAFTPDSKYAVGIASGYLAKSNYLLVYNLQTLEIERFVEIPGYHEFSDILCQTGL